MKRRELLTLMGGAAVWPVRAHSQKQAARVGVLMDDNGGLVAYGIDLDEHLPKAADYVSRILKGEKAGELPVQAPTRFRMTVNLRTAKTLDLQIPPTLLALADEVIE
jgi:ABC-type uncharacterized transport system substrate-binding protein